MCALALKLLVCLLLLTLMCGASGGKRRKESHKRENQPQGRERFATRIRSRKQPKHFGRAVVVQFILVNGSRPWEGRVEVIRNGVRGSVCDDQWDNQDASVICKTLGYRYGGEVVSGGYFGEGQGPIWLDNVQCTGREDSLANCAHDEWGRSDCTHSEDAGVRCYLYHRAITARTTRRPAATRRPTIPVNLITTTEKSVDIKVNLIGGRDKSEGNVEVVINNMKYHICDDYWDNKGATVICRMLGYRAGGLATEKSFFGNEGDYIIIIHVTCKGTETRIGDCLATAGVNKRDCGTDEFAGVICTKDSPVESHTNVTTSNQIFGTETSIVDCSNKKRVNKHDCGTDEFAGVICFKVESPTNVTTSGQTLGICGQRPYDYFKRHQHSPIIDTSPHHHQDKIVGGYLAAHGSNPWQVRVDSVKRINGTLYGIQHCGATIISEYFLLTSAHCFYGKDKDGFRMTIGDHSLRVVDNGEQIFTLEELILHENYRNESNDYDIALVKIHPVNGHGIQFNHYVQPICLPDVNTPITEGSRCMISGWGNMNPTKNQIQYSDTLRYAFVSVISQNMCKNFYKKPNRTDYYTDRMMCAGYIDGSRDTCNGDSGGPLVCKIGDAYTLMGITSWGRGCALPNAPGVYARVTAFLPWIDSKIALHSESEAEKKLPRKPDSIKS